MATYESVKEHVMRYSQSSAHRSRHDFKHPDHLAVVAMGAAAAPFLFRLLQDHPRESTHFCYNVIPLLIKAPSHIVKQMHEEAVKDHGSFRVLDVQKMVSIYKQWGQELEQSNGSLESIQPLEASGGDQQRLSEASDTGQADQA
jgi:hypothetical protein